ncbi:rubrerythrin [Pyrodictium occultum]|uniref:Rubrerythrin n=1 Tax=Pyrodictium occultum TaxID=2309 RepID=A0A0V8RXA6_PYROC|nr:ferritin family protein [Pyrodictium occultum]KSW12669.1 rubrerythrin [Pyrodictium occultum]
MKHPLDVTRDVLAGGDLADAVRLAIIAELDAISFYLQVARRTQDRAARKVFEDVAREEKTHVGEFLALLKRLDPDQAEELEKGFREVEEMLEERRES